MVYYDMILFSKHECDLTNNRFELEELLNLPIITSKFLKRYTCNKDTIHIILHSLSSLQRRRRCIFPSQAKRAIETHESISNKK